MSKMKKIKLIQPEEVSDQEEAGSTVEGVKLARARPGVPPSEKEPAIYNMTIP